METNSSKYFSAGDCLLSWDCGNANCNNPIPASQFFYNAQTGACENAWYLGCGGNYNFFSSQLECHNFCVVKNGNKSPMVPVDVLAVAPDAQEPIGKNRNLLKPKNLYKFLNYSSEKNCSLEWNDGYENCAKPKPGDLYYFNSEKNSCEKNYFLGCEGNANFFVSQEECSGICMSI